MHLVETMAYAGEKPWHGLGNRLAPQQSIEVWKRQAGMDWKIEEAEVRYVAGSNNIGVIHAFPEQKVLYRSDTRSPLSVVSKRFQVVQPGQILEFYRDLTASSGFELETAGVLREGRKFWALARTGQSTTLKGRDKVDGYLLLATACDIKDGVVIRRMHNGTDYLTKPGDAVLSPFDGIVTAVNTNSTQVIGNFIQITHADGRRAEITYVLPLQGPMPIKVGTRVARGSLLGRAADLRVAYPRQPNHIHVQYWSPGAGDVRGYWMSPDWRARVRAR